jgi:hypothetical protein
VASCAALLLLLQTGAPTVSPSCLQKPLDLKVTHAMLCAAAAVVVPPDSVLPMVLLQNAVLGMQTNGTACPVACYWACRAQSDSTLVSPCAKHIPSHPLVDCKSPVITQLSLRALEMRCHIRQQFLINTLQPRVLHSHHNLACLVTAKRETCAFPGRSCGLHQSSTFRQPRTGLNAIRGSMYMYACVACVIAVCRPAFWPHAPSTHASRGHTQFQAI